MGKQKARQGPERRRPLAEVNLMASQKPPRSAGSRRGCLQLFGIIATSVAGAALVAALVR